MRHQPQKTCLAHRCRLHWEGEPSRVLVSSGLLRLEGLEWMRVHRCHRSPPPPEQRDHREPFVPSISVTLSDGATAEGPTVELLLPVADAAAAVAAASLLASLAAVAANVAFARAAPLAGLGRGFLFICRAQAS